MTDNPQPKACVKLRVDGGADGIVCQGVLASMSPRGRLDRSARI